MIYKINYVQNNNNYIIIREIIKQLYVIKIQKYVS